VKKWWKVIAECSKLNRHVQMKVAERGMNNYYWEHQEGLPLDWISLPLDWISLFSPIIVANMIVLYSGYAWMDMRQWVTAHTFCYRWSSPDARLRKKFTVSPTISWLRFREFLHINFWGALTPPVRRIFYSVAHRGTVFSVNFFHS